MFFCVLFEQIPLLGLKYCKYKGDTKVRRDLNKLESNLMSLAFALETIHQQQEYKRHLTWSVQPKQEKGLVKVKHSIVNLKTLIQYPPKGFQICTTINSSCVD